MAGELSDLENYPMDVVPAGYVIDQVNGRDTIRCTSCGQRWYAERMTHTANTVFLLDHRHKHCEKMPDLRRCKHTVAIGEVGNETRCFVCGAIVFPPRRMR